jgi:DNA-directed RNA polymerase subunit E'/Rpb7
MEDIFVRAVLVDKIKVSPTYLRKNKATILHNILVDRFEGKCSYHGYIKRQSIAIVKCSAGIVKDVCLNGDVEYNISYSALVCNPAIGSVVRAKVVNQNMFGILAEVYVMGNVVLEIVIAKMIEPGDEPLDNIKINDMVNVEIIKKKFELGDEKIINVGKIIKGDAAMRGGAFDEEEVIEADAVADEEEELEEDEEDAEEKDEDAEEEEEEEQSEDEDADLEDEEAIAAEEEVEEEGLWSDEGSDDGASSGPGGGFSDDD